MTARMKREQKKAAKIYLDAVARICHAQMMPSFEWREFAYAEGVSRDWQVAYLRKRLFHHALAPSIFVVTAKRQIFVSRYRNW